ncbi:MAG TPA: HAMP domain-containing sensor histidine kinase [Acidimicrobiales bacterium]|nr:HAMP domain-containing sensor histidine kinase [Acidimicrobiales bacterium]
MTRRLLLSYLGLAVLILLILEVPLAVLGQRFERQLATNQIEKEANGLVALTADSLGESRRAQLQTLVAGYEERTGGEVTVVSVTGEVLAASSRDADRDATQEYKTVIARALGGQTAAVFSRDEGRPYAVAAAPVIEDGRLAAAVVVAAPASLTQDRIHEIWLALGIFAAGAIVVAALVGLILARSLAHSLGKLEATVDRFGRGELSSRAGETEGPEEIRSLARQFNHMAAQLDELIEAQTRFVADASHQLRSPLTALRLRIENLEATADEASVESISAVGREVQRLSRIVDGLLTLGRAGQGAPAPVEVTVAAVIAERCDAWSPLAAEKDVSIEAVDEVHSDVRRRLHPGDLEQILDNLLANAVEVSPPASRIRVVLRPSGHGQAEIHVIDQGPGLAEEDRKRAFDRFWQGSARPSGHSGLGLAIVRQLATRNGLDVALRSAQPVGLDAVVVLPPPTR